MGKSRTRHSRLASREFPFLHRQLLKRFCPFGKWKERTFLGKGRGGAKKEGFTAMDNLHVWFQCDFLLWRGVFPYSHPLSAHLDPDSGTPSWLVPWQPSSGPQTSLFISLLFSCHACPTPEGPPCVSGELGSMSKSYRTV